LPSSPGPAGCLASVVRLRPSFVCHRPARLHVTRQGSRLIQYSGRRPA
jgi:hypothetical protein